MLTEAADEVFPIKKSSATRIPYPPWWDSECYTAVKRRKEMELRYRAKMNEENYNDLMTIVKETKKLLKKKKVDSWRNFCVSLSPDTHL